MIVELKIQNDHFSFHKDELQNNVMLNKKHKLLPNLERYSYFPVNVLLLFYYGEPELDVNLFLPLIICVIVCHKFYVYILRVNRFFFQFCLDNK